MKYFAITFEEGEKVRCYTTQSEPNESLHSFAISSAREFSKQGHRGDISIYREDGRLEGVGLYRDDKKFVYVPVPETDEIMRQIQHVTN